MPYEEGKIGLKHYRIINSIILLFCFIFTDLYSQFNINGFCRVQKFKTLPGYEKIYQTDYKLNNVTDLVFYTNDRNNVVLHSSENKFQFKNPINKFFYFPISSIGEIYNNQKDNYHVFVSRNEKLAGLVSFTRYGTMQILNLQKFDSFPSKIVIDNFDNSIEKEAVVFGSAFEGLSILRKNSYKLEETHFLAGKSISEVVTIDLDFDGYKDIIAKDLLDNSLLFLYNNHYGQFEVERTWEFDSTIENISVLDFNKDDFSDLVFNSDNGITICYGDSVFSFSIKDSWPTSEEPDIRIINDFNQDGDFDFLSYNKLSGNFNFNFNTKSLEPDKWFTLLNDTCITDIKMLKGVKNTLLALTNKGRYYTISNISKLDSSITIPSLSADTFIPFSNKNNLLGIAFLDTTKLELNLTYSEEKLFNKKLIVPIADRFRNITSVNNYQNQAYFILNSDSTELFQIIKPGINDSNFIDFKLYSDFPIIDLTASKDSTTEPPLIYTLVAKEDTVGYVKYTFKDFHYISTQFDKIAENVLDAKLKYESGLVVEFCTSIGDSIALNKHHLFENRSDITSTISLPIAAIQKAGYFDNYCLVTSNSQQYLISTDKYTVVKIPKEVKYQLTDLVSCGNKSNKILARDSKGGIILLELNKAKSKLSLVNYIVSEGVDSYFCTMLQGKKYLAYKLVNNDFINLLEFK